VIVTPHAQARWEERFPGEELAAAYAQAQRGRVGRKTRAKLRKACPGNLQYMTSGFAGRYYLMTPTNIVFVMQPPETIITVFRLEDQPGGQERTES